MGATLAKTVADLRRRRLQTAVIAVVLFLASAAATLALGILIESNAPFERAFAAANGAHLALTYDGGLPADRLAATAQASPVTASAGPWPVTMGALAHPKGGLILGGQFSGRPMPDASIDAVTIEAGRWWQAPGEVVLDQDIASLLDRHVGDTLNLYPAPASAGGKSSSEPVEARPDSGFPTGHAMTVVGIAGSVSTPDVAAWMSPADVAALSPGQVPAQEMLYRVRPAATAGDLTAATAAITAGLPSDALIGTASYLDVKKDVDRVADLYVPVLLAFSLFALLAAGFTIANIVGGVVLSGYRDIGVMKAIGFTPGQVTGILVGQMLLPVAVGTVAGVVVGTIASQPIISQTAMSFGLPATFEVSAPAVAAVVGLALLTALVASIGPAVRAGRLSVVAAITRGTAPSARAGAGRFRRFGLALPAPLPVRLGVAAGASHPARAAMTLGALTVGVVAATFALGLNLSLMRVMEDINRDQATPVRVELPSSDPARAAGVSAAIAADPQTARFVALGEGEVAVPRLGAARFVGYQGDASWIGYALISGRWFTAPGEVVAPTALFTATGLHVGDTLRLTLGGRSVDVRLVGEVFDAEGSKDDLLAVRGTWADLATLDPAAVPDAWEAQPTAGVDPAAYRSGLIDATDRTVPISLSSDSSGDASFLLFLTVVGVLGLVLVATSLAGVFNTVLLETRQRSREIAVLKTVGLTPRQVVGLVVSSIAPVALAAGVVGVPLGMVAQRAVLGYMGQVAARTAIPESVFDVFSPALLVALLLLGLAIGAAGAFLPARRVARAPIAPVLQAE